MVSRTDAGSAAHAPSVGACAMILFLLGCGSWGSWPGQRPPEPRETSAMPKMIQLRREQPGVVGVTATVVTVEEGKLHRQKLVNDKVVEQTERELRPEEVDRVQRALVENDYQSLPRSSGAPTRANVGKLVLEVDGERAEAESAMGMPAEKAAAGASGRLEAIANVLEELAE